MAARFVLKPQTHTPGPFNPQAKTYITLRLGQKHRCDNQKKTELIPNLGFVKMGVMASGRHKLLVISAFNDRAFIQDQNLIGFGNGAQTVGDHNRCTPL